MTKIRTLMVDDSREFLDAAARFLGIDRKIEVVGKVSLGREVVEAIKRTTPDVLLLDLAMPDLHGLEVIRNIRAQIKNPPQIIVLTFYDNPEYRAQADSLGVADFIYKSDFGVSLIPAIHRLKIKNGNNPEFVEG